MSRPKSAAAVAAPLPPTTGYAVVLAWEAGEETVDLHVDLKDAQEHAASCEKESCLTVDSMDTYCVGVKVHARVVPVSVAERKDGAA